MNDQLQDYARTELKTGLAQLGSVWLPLPHLLMIPTIWNDFMWHSGLAGAIQSMFSFVGTGLVIYFFLKKLGVGMFGRLFGILIFVSNINILYLQSTAMTELLLLATMTAGSYYLMAWSKDKSVLNLIKSSFFIMLSIMQTTEDDLMLPEELGSGLALKKGQIYFFQLPK